MLHGNNTKINILNFIHCQLCRIQVIVFYTYSYLIFVLRPLSNAPKEIVHIIVKFQCNLTTSSNSLQQGLLVGCFGLILVFHVLLLLWLLFFCFHLTCDEYIKTFFVVYFIISPADEPRPMVWEVVEQTQVVHRLCIFP